MRTLALVAPLVLAIPALAHAQPAATSVIPAPAPATTHVDRVDPWIAAGLSLGGTVLAASAGVYALRDGDPDLALVAGLGLVALPTAGHWYAGETWSAGLAIRVAGAVTTGVLLARANPCATGDCHEGEVVAAIATGASIALVGAAVDLIAAPLAAQRTNRKARARLTVAPTIAPGHAGLALAGSF